MISRARFLAWLLFEAQTEPISFQVLGAAHMLVRRSVFVWHGGSGATPRKNRTNLDSAENADDKTRPAKSLAQLNMGSAMVTHPAADRRSSLVSAGNLGPTWRTAVVFGHWKVEANHTPPLSKKARTMSHLSTQSLAWLGSENPSQTRLTPVRISLDRHPIPAQTESAQESEPHAAEDLMSGLVVLAFSVVVIMATAWMARNMMIWTGWLSLSNLLHALVGV